MSALPAGTTRRRLSALHRAITTWYAEHGRADLPWRAPDCTPWGVFVSEIMAQQTPLSRVEPRWRWWMDRWPHPAALAEASPGEAVQAWDRLGYPRRALRLHQAAIAMVDTHHGEVPSTYAELRALPGVGDYTAAAVACFAFGRPEVVIDTNVHRVLSRTVLARAQAAPTLTAAERQLAAAVMPRDAELACRWNVAAMELGALICTARKPLCDSCPAQRQCAWLRAGRPADQGPPRRGQRYEGTDRQARGVMLALLRERASQGTGATSGRATVAELLAAWSDPRRLHDGFDPEQADRALAGLLADRLVERDGAHGIRLPR